MDRRRIKKRAAAMAAVMVLVWSGGCIASVQEGDRRDVTAEEGNGEYLRRRRMFLLGRVGHHWGRGRRIS